MTFIPTLKQQEALQLLKSDARYFMLYGGSRSGKTAIIIYVQLMTALMVPGSWHLICRLHLSELKSAIIHDTLPKIAELIDPGLGNQVIVNMNKSDFYVKLNNNSMIWFHGLSDNKRADKVLGNEYGTVFFNEITQLQYPAVQKCMTRCAQKMKDAKNRMFFDCNPTTKNHWAYKLFVDNKDPIDYSDKKPERYKYLLMNPGDNPHLPEDYDEILGELSQRQQLRFREGVWQSEIDGALWTQELLDCNRTAPMDFEEYDRMVIAVDPAVSSEKTSDETGIIVCGLAGDTVHVLHDASGRHTPLEWAKLVNRLYHRYQADRVICEVNQGGDLVEGNLRSVFKNMPIKQIRAYKGKSLRAEPVVALYEAEQVKHTPDLMKLEDQMLTWVPSEPGFSPDRIDALVYAVTELLLSHGGASIQRL